MADSRGQYQAQRGAGQNLVKAVVGLRPKCSEETKAKIRAALTGKSFITDSGRARIREANKRRKVSPETRARLSAALIGNKRSAGKNQKPHSTYCGHKNHFWKGGVTIINHGLRLAVVATHKYGIWRLSIFVRDSFICQDCKRKNLRLHAHHKKHFQTIIDEYNITTVEQAIACEELWDINNGITLCKRCHRKRHNAQQ